MNPLSTIPDPISIARRGPIALAVAVLAGLLLLAPGGARAARPAAAKAATSKVKARFDRLSVKGVRGGVLVRGSVLPGSQHGSAKVILFLRHGTQGAFKRAKTVKLAADDRNFALLDDVAPGRYGVKVSFQDPGKVVSTTSSSSQVTVAAVFGHPMSPGSVHVSGGAVTYGGSIPAPKSATSVALLALDLGPIASSTPGVPHTPSASFKSLATTQVGTGTSAVTFTLHATLKQGQRWALLLERSKGHQTGIDYAGLKTVRVN